MVRINDWRGLDAFPTSTGEWAVREKSATVPISAADAQRFVKKIAAQMGVGGPLISSPSTKHFLPAVRVPELQGPILANVASGLKTLSWVAFSLALLCAGLLATGRASAPDVITRTTGLLVLIAAFWFYNHRVAARDPAIYRDWAIYLDWQRRFAGANLRVPLAVIAVFGLLQWGFSLAGYERDFLFHRFGVVFADIDRGEWWRLLVGPFLHASATHWALNFVLCLLVLPYLTPFRNRWGVLLLAYGSVVFSAVAVFAQSRFGLATIYTDSFAGVSALVYFACGFALSNAWRCQDWYPARHASSLFVITLILLASPHVLGDQISFVAHAAGLLVGLAAGSTYKPT
jgi:membrane associated rhomboid family serine protease